MSPLASSAWNFSKCIYFQVGGAREDGLVSMHTEFLPLLCEATVVEYRVAVETGEH